MARQLHTVSRRGRFVRFMLRRLAGAIALVFIVASGALLLAQLAPGDYSSQVGEDSGTPSYLGYGGHISSSNSRRELSARRSSKALNR